MTDDAARLYVWYDNEFGYSCQVGRVLERLVGEEAPSYPAQWVAACALGGTPAGSDISAAASKDGLGCSFDAATFSLGGYPLRRAKEVNYGGGNAHGQNRERHRPY